MERRTLAAFAVAAALFVAAVAVGVFAPGGGSVSAEVLLARSAAAMADESFTMSGTCEHCETPTLVEYAPRGIRITAGTPRGEAWPHDLFLDGNDYVSETGRRWRSADGTTLQMAWARVTDPRVLLRALEQPDLEGREQVDGRTSHVVSGTLDGTTLAEELPPDAQPFLLSALGKLLHEATIRVWIAPDGYRLLRLELHSPNEEFGGGAVDFEYGPVNLPDSVESMDAEEAHAFSEDVERGGTRLLRAIGAYERANGAYPAEVTPQTVGAFLPAAGWPANAFTGEPVRYAPGTPGNFDYSLIAAGQHIQFQIDGWDGSQLYYDTERFGPIPEEVGRLGE